VAHRAGPLRRILVHESHDGHADPARSCRLDFVAAWNLFRWFPVTPILKFFGKRFIAQDQDVIERQRPGLKVQPRMMLIDDADRQARWYFQLKAAYLAAAANGSAHDASARWAGDAALAELMRRDSLALSDVKGDPWFV